MLIAHIYKKEGKWWVHDDHPKVPGLTDLPSQLPDTCPDQVAKHRIQSSCRDRLVLLPYD